MSSFIYELLSKAFDVLKSPKLLAWIALILALFLYILASIVPYADYQNLKNKYGIWALLILIGSISMLTIEGVIYLYKHIRKTSNINQYRKNWSFLSFYRKSNRNWKSSMPFGFIPLKAVLSGKSRLKIPSATAQLKKLGTPKNLFDIKNILSTSILSFILCPI